LFTATLGAFALGNVLAWTAPTQYAIETEDELGFDVSEQQFAWVGSLLTIGAAASTLPTGFLVDFIGRKNTMFWMALPFFAGWAIIAWAQNVAMLYVGRIITGFCGGVFSVASPLYIGEIAEKDIRGTLGTSFQLMVVIGIEFTYVVGAYTSVFTISIISAVIPLIFALIFFWMPETPQYHLKRNKPEEAKQALQWFRGGDAVPQHIVDNELQEMKSSLDASKPVPLKHTFKTRAAQRAMIVSVGLMIAQQLSGINAVIFYTDTLFKSAGSSLSSTYSVMIVGFVQLVFTIVAALVIDKLGRRILLLFSFTVMGVCTLLLGVCLYYVEQSETGQLENWGWAPLFLLCLYMVAFSLGAGPIPWLLLGELFASEIKGTASSISALINWLMAFLVTKFYSSLVEAINGSSTFWIFTGCLVISVIFVFFVMPETRGKTLEEIQIELGGVSNLSHAELAPHQLSDVEKK
jgi:sugar porter (SP) family MFS transporter